MLPRFARLRFGPGFWAFTFSWAATASYALKWIALRRPAGAIGYAVVILTAITAFIGSSAARTAVLAARGQLLPRARPEQVTIAPPHSLPSTTDDFSGVPRQLRPAERSALARCRCVSRT